MKKLLSVALSILLAATAAVSLPWNLKAQGKEVVIKHELAPMNRDAVIDKLIADGTLSANASAAQVEQALKNYAGKASVKLEKTKYTKKRASLFEKKFNEAITNGTFSGNKIGQTKGKYLDPASPVSYNSSVKTIKVLVLLAEYSDMNHNNIAQPANPKSSYWTKDFSVEHYRNLLFSENGYTTPEGIYSPSLKSYFKDQSNGNLNIEGDVFGWYKVSKPAKYYGEDINGERGDDNAPRELVVEVSKMAVKDGVDLSKYDVEDQFDFDNDGDLMESDGIVDHLMVLHAGEGQENGGGVLGADAIWSHSWDLVVPTTIDGTNTQIYSYTTEPEDGAVGVLCHEFTHDLGIPDDYDTEYTGDGTPVEYWSVMDGGSYTGRPSGTLPTGINPYSRILLGLMHGGDWINWGTLNINKLTKPIETQLRSASLPGSDLQAILINLPNQEFKSNNPIGGSYEFSGGRASEIDNSMVLKLDLTGKSDVKLSYDLWFNIEDGWDAGFVQVSEDGVTWKSLSTPYTKTFENKGGYPTIMDSLPGYSGSSNGWVKENIDLSAYAGKNISVRLRYATDWVTELDGMYVDNIIVTADGKVVISEDAENGFGAIENHGFTKSQGEYYVPHYYVAEWRNHQGVDEGLAHVWKAEMQYNQGMVLWYRNEAYSDNWMGVHPGYAYIGAVDATQHVYIDNGIGNGNENGTRAGYIPSVQMHDAAFSLDKAADIDFSVYSFYKTFNLKGQQAEPVFDDSKSYYDPRSPHSGLYLPSYGLNIRVTGRASDYSVGQILIGK